MTEPRSVMVVGGGIIGLSLAWELAGRGVSVRLFDRDSVGRATSWAGAGILPPANLENATDPMDRLRGLSHELFPQWAQELESETGIDAGLRRCGGWYLADTVGEHASLLGMAGYWNQLGIESEEVSLSEVALREPALSDWAGRPEARSAWWVPDEYQLRSPWFLRALREACERRGVVIEEKSSVDDVRGTEGGAQILVDDHWQTADAVTLSAGAWIGRIANSLRLGRSVIPVRGQVLLLRTDQPVCQRVLNVGHRYLVCREDGHVLVGSCEEEVGFSLGTTDEVLHGLHEFAVQVVPALKKATKVKAWSGLRPMTFDGFPMIGGVPNLPNVFIAGGHFRSGLHLAPATAILLADMIMGRKPRIDPQSFGVGKQQHHSPPSQASVFS